MLPNQKLGVQPSLQVMLTQARTECEVATVGHPGTKKGAEENRRGF